jgi:LacI family repressor for deo operon, udp, cdd, tsx, nupC, and nupG
MRSRRATIKDIAKETGYSIATVSRVINNKGMYYSKEAETKIKQTAKKLNYSPYAIARELKKQKTNNIGVIVPYIDDYYAEVFSAIQSYASEKGYSVALLNSNYDIKQEEMNIKSIKEQRFAGLIIVTELMHHKKIYELKQEAPVVSIGKIGESLEVPYVAINDKEISKKAVNYLISLGHRRIAFLSGPLTIANEKERFNGYIEALQENNLKIDPALIYEGNIIVKNVFKEGYSLINTILRETSDITAFFITSDYVAFAAIKAITDLGKKIPRDISIIGFDNLPITEFSRPALTTVSQDKRTIGYKSIETLLEVIKGGKPCNTIVDANIIVRESTGEAPGFSKD